MHEFFLPVIKSALRSTGIETDKQIIIEQPADKKFGDFSTNIALLTAKECKSNPRELAHQIIEHLVFPPDTIAQIEVAGPGFINFHFTSFFIMHSVRQILHEGNAYGKGSIGKGKRAIVEYVSANPTGPLTIGRGRGGVLGDCLANLFAAQGYEVTIRLVTQIGNQGFVHHHIEQAPDHQGVAIGCGVRDVLGSNQRPRASLIFHNGRDVEFFT